MPTFRVHFASGHVLPIEADTPALAREAAKPVALAALGTAAIRITRIKLDRSARHQSRRETRLTRFR